MNKKDKEIMSAYVMENEAQETEQPVKVQAVPMNVPPIEDIRKNTALEEARAQRLHGREDLPVTGDGGLEYKDNLGYFKLNLADFPTKGLFYPEGTTVMIRAARGAEIKHWSTMDISDLNSISRTDDICNFVVERCMSIKMPGVYGSGWKDLKDIDRLYVLMAIHDYTFLNGENELLINISENDQRVVRKEDVDFIQIPEKIMQYYNSTERCFTFTSKTNGHKFNMYIPSLGVSDWVKNYCAIKQQINEGFDADFAIYAPFLIKDHRGLTQAKYEEFVDETSRWSTKEWSIVSYVREQLADASSAKFKYTEGGVEREVPLNFRGGLKALFTIHDPLSDFC